MITTEHFSAERLASAFSTAVFKELAQSVPDISARKRIALIAQYGSAHSDASLGDAFENAYKLLLRDYRNEYVFKNGLVSKIIFGKYSPRTASALMELRMGRSWADVMVVNGTSTTYEIKTDLDQFGRLASQLADYTSRSEFVNVVTSDKRASNAESHLPPHVGVVALRKNGALVTLRQAKSNLDHMSAVDLYSMLRTQEALNILGDLTGYTADVPRGHLWKRLRELFAELPVRSAHAGAILQLRARGRTAAELSTTKGFPPSLRALAFSTELSAIGRRRVLDRLSAPVSLALDGC